MEMLNFIRRLFTPRFGCYCTSLLMLLILTAHPVASQPRIVSSSAVCSDETIGQLDRLDELMVNLHDGLINAHVLVAPRIRQACHFWEQVDALELASAIVNYYGQAGGFVSPQARLLPPGSFPTFVDAGDASIRFSFPGFGGSYFYTRRKGMPSCELRDLSPGSSTLAIDVLANLECVYALHLRSVAVSLGLDFLSWGSIGSSGVDAALENYLGELQTSGILTGYVLDMEAGEARFTILNDLRVHRLPILLHSVNIYESPADEVTAVREFAQQESSAQLIFPSGETNGSPLSYATELIIAGLETVGALPPGVSAADRRLLFRRELGLADDFTDRTTCQPASPLSYPTGTVTPKNNDVVVFRGPDTDFSDNQPLQTALKNLRYTIKKVDGKRMKISDLPGALCPLVEAQTLFLNTHGSSGSGEFLCDPAIAYATSQCCDFVKLAAQDLGLTGASSMNCTQANPPMQDPTGSLWATASGNQDCGHSTTSNSSKMNRCLVMYSPTRMFNPSTGFGPKAAVFSSMCDGGVCVNSALNPVGVMDFYTGSTTTNYTNVMVCDAELARKDIFGQSQYCRTPSLYYNEPFNQGACEYFDYLTPNPLYGLRALQNSISFRGAAFALGSVTRFCFSNDPGANSSNFKRYRITRVGGEPQTRVEFAPSVASLDFTGGAFNLQFTSSLDGGVQLLVPIAPNFPVFNSGAANFVTAPNIQPAGIGFTFSSNVNIAPGALFLTNSSELIRRWGADASNWPWFVTVKVQGTAGNGVRMVGNVEASRKWAYVDGSVCVGTEPWKKFNGRFPTGGNVFEAKIPGVPKTACCLPNLELDVNGTHRQNGCSCVNDRDYSDCQRVECCIPNVGCLVDQHTSESCAALNGEFRVFAGGLHLWAQCCGSNGANCTSVVETTLIENPTCPENDNAVVSTTRSQYLPMPFNEQDVQHPPSCPPIEHRLHCSSSSGSSSSSAGSSSSGGGSSGGGSSGGSSSSGSGKGNCGGSGQANCTPHDRASVPL